MVASAPTGGMDLLRTQEHDVYGRDQARTPPGSRAAVRNNTEYIKAKALLDRREPGDWRQAGL